MNRTFIVGDTHGHVDRFEALLEQECLPDFDVEIVHVGDVGHYGYETQARDRDIWEYALDVVDVFLWGNHDRAIVDSKHEFIGQTLPFSETEEAIKNAGMLWAYDAHGCLITHAGLHPDYASDISLDEFVLAANADEHCQLHDAISRIRGGFDHGGGLLWRDTDEDLYAGYRQVFGHSSGPTIRWYNEKTSVCIDVGNKDNGRLCGLWLPEMKIAEINR